VFDLNGNRIKTLGKFPGSGSVLAFDSYNHHLYTLFGGGGPTRGAAFDEEGNPAKISGTFGDVTEPVAAVFDPFNRRIYVADFVTNISVYDEQGNGVKFPAVNMKCGNPPGALAFDPHNRHFYASATEALGCFYPIITVFDEAGNIVKTTGTFPNVGANPIAMTFDAHNNRLYVENGPNSVTVYDEEGHQITTSGTFPNVGGFGLVAAPQ
ncbi:MAG: hypothetical protein JO322_13665, partial [Candidatus Eremiobacteraeota bacterium]|nr:hypothetical protein [Candidatus Eremiobacteraeota bacterium]